MSISMPKLPKRWRRSSSPRRPDKQKHERQDAITNALLVVVAILTGLVLIAASMHGLPPMPR
jgi:hypothetical protein